MNGMAQDKETYWERLARYNRFPTVGKIKIDIHQLQVLVEAAYEAGSSEATGFLNRLGDLGKQVEDMIGGGQ